MKFQKNWRRLLRPPTLASDGARPIRNPQRPDEGQSPRRQARWLVCASRVLPPGREKALRRHRRTTRRGLGKGRGVHLRPRGPSGVLERPRAREQRARSRDGYRSPTLRRAWLRVKTEAAMCVQGVDVHCVLQFTLIHAAGCALHRRTSRVIHRSKL